MTDQEQPHPGEGPAAPVIELGEPPPAVSPPVAWAPAAPEAIGISIGGVLRDTFARYAADPIRLFLVGLIPSALVLFVADDPGPTLVVSVLSLISTSIAMVLGDRGPREPFGAAAGLGIRRAGWLMVTSLAIVILVMGVALVPLVLIALTAGRNVGLFWVLLLLLGIPLAWVYMRLILAIPGVVIDQLRPNPAMKQARAATRKVSTTVQLFVVVLLASLVSTPVALAAGALLVADFVPPFVILGVGGVLIAFVAPVSPLAFVSMYRRVYARAELAPAAAIGADTDVDGDVEAAAADLVVEDAASESPTHPAPAYGPLARGLAGATLTLGIGGIVAFVWVLGALAAGALAGATGNVPRGTILFGPAASVETCTVASPFTVMARGGSITWMGSIPRRTAASDRIRLVITVDGVVAADLVQPSGVFDCLGNDIPETGFDPGVYTLTLYVNDVASATGTFTVQ